MFEKEVAEYFGGMRRVRISYGEVGSDIIHPLYSIECKYGRFSKTIPAYLCVDMPTLLDGYYVYPSNMFDVSCVPIHKQNPIHAQTKNYNLEFLHKAFNQAKSYDTKRPIVCVKAKGMRGFIIVLEVNPPAYPK